MFQSKANYSTCSIASIAPISVSNCALVNSARNGCIWSSDKAVPRPASSTLLEDLDTYNSSLKRGLLTAAMLALATAYWNKQQKSLRQKSLNLLTQKSLNLLAQTGNCQITRNPRNPLNKVEKKSHKMPTLSFQSKSTSGRAQSMRGVSWCVVSCTAIVRPLPGQCENLRKWLHYTIELKLLSP